MLKTFFLEQVRCNVEAIDRGITGALYEFPTTGHRMIGARNFHTLQPDAPGGADRYWANGWGVSRGRPTPIPRRCTRWREGADQRCRCLCP